MIKRKDGMHAYDVIKRYNLENAEIETETMRFLSDVDQQRHERMREYGLL